MRGRGERVVCHNLAMSRAAATAARLICKAATGQQSGGTNELVGRERDGGVNICSVTSIIRGTVTVKSNPFLSLKSPIFLGHYYTD